MSKPAGSMIRSCLGKARRLTFPGLKPWAVSRSSFGRLEYAQENVQTAGPSGGCYEIACALPREEVKYWKISEFSIPGKGELLWGQVAQRSVGSRVAQKGLSTQQNDSVGEQSHDPSEVEAIEKESP